MEMALASWQHACASDKNTMHLVRRTRTLVRLELVQSTGAGCFDALYIIGCDVIPLDARV